MTSTPVPHRDAADLASEARSILACPRSASLVVEGRPDAVDGDLTLQDAGGVPVLLGEPGSPLAQVAEAGHHALLRVEAALEAPRVAASGPLHLVIAGTLEPHGPAPHGRVAIALAAERVSVVRPGADGVPDQHLPVSIEEFGRNEYELNRGYFHRCTQHAAECHQAELRNTVALMTSTHPSRVAGVVLDELDRHGLRLRWVDHEGAHERRVRFGRAAESPDDLAGLLSRHLPQLPH